MPLTDLAARSCIHLSAIDPARNCDRRYQIERSSDLFGEQIIELSWGRAGRRGQGKRLSAPSEEEAILLVRRVLARRNTATDRIGTAYRPQARIQQSIFSE
ncbi:WGR domain-containing protein [Aurantiacibacter poecillastricola]|uniref:WGR domain-containing protein n=1 Tax=Aurantiacibacter poecillastricola TaxID=3064385 RepID=UPI00273D2246|nr:WGR domain-containing protein [Aurantiacibacter sp. 219JJ12-13]MDP5263390.1 WGR domain-containing protein [Aurantiacibacter sp. 219JJ12-13]